MFLFLAALGLHCFIAACGLSLVAASGGYSSLRWAGFSLRWLLLLWSTGCRPVGSVAVACGLYSAGSVVVEHGLVTPQHVGSSRTRDQTHVPCIGRRILNHCATREGKPLKVMFYVSILFLVLSQKLNLKFVTVWCRIITHILPMNKLKVSNLSSSIT